VVAWVKIAGNSHLVALPVKASLILVIINMKGKCSCLAVLFLLQEKQDVTIC
jgi:hypothetical protein